MSPQRHDRQKAALEPGASRGAREPRDRSAPTRPTTRRSDPRPRRNRPSAVAPAASAGERNYERGYEVHLGYGLDRDIVQP
jgi:hypothetical protein